MGRADFPLGDRRVARSIPREDLEVAVNRTDKRIAERPHRHPGGNKRPVEALRDGGTKRKPVHPISLDRAPAEVLDERLQPPNAFEEGPPKQVLWRTSFFG